MKNVREFFKNPFIFAAVAEKFSIDLLEGKKLDWTFVQDFALAEWGSGEDGVEETYHKVIK